MMGGKSCLQGGGAQGRIEATGGHEYLSQHGKEAVTLTMEGRVGWKDWMGDEGSTMVAAISNWTISS